MEVIKVKELVEVFEELEKRYGPNGMSMFMLTLIRI